MRSTPYRIVAGVTAAIGLSAIPLSAHDFWIVPDAFQVASGRDMSVRTVTGVKFPTSESAVTANRIAGMRVLAATSAGDLPLTDFSVSGKSLVVPHRPTGAGQRVIEASLVPSVRRMSGEGFAKYLRLEGAEALADRYAREGRLPSDSIDMRSAKFAKTIVEVGTGGPRAWSRLAGHPVEIVPMTDPFMARRGDTLAMRVLWQGKALADAHVHVGVAAAGAELSSPDISLTSDKDGVIRIPLHRGGLWNARASFAAPAELATTPQTWDVAWATLVFHIDQGSRGRVAPRTSARASDSADVVATVARLHVALSRGDSATVLRMLAPDVTVLESGSFETRDEYRGHHLPADIAFAAALPGTHTVVAVAIQDNAAWVSSTSVTEGQYKGRPVNSAGAELIVLSRNGSGADWRIRAIHWSSRRRTP